MADPTVRASALPELQIISVSARRGQDLTARAQQLFGMALPTPGKCVMAKDLRIVCTTPGQFLFIREGGDDTLGNEATAAWGDVATLIDLSGSRVAVRVTGPDARAALAKFLPLDLHPRAMQPGDAAATVAAHLPILLWQHDAAPTYDLLCARSLAGSFRRSLELAGL